MPACGSQSCNPFAFTALAPFGFVPELLVVEKHLLPGRKDEVRPAVDALQHLVLEFHLRMLLQPVSAPTHSPDEKPRLSPGARMRRIFASSPSVVLPPGLGPPCPWAEHGLLLLHTNCGDPWLGACQTTECSAEKGRDRPPREGAVRFRSILLFP